MRLVPLSREQHARLRIDPAKAGAAAATVHLVPVVLSEVRKAAAHYPLFFAKDGETGEFYPAVLLGLEPHENLYWTGAELDAAYVPLNLLRHPFYVGGEDAQHGRICVDLDSPAVGPEGGCAILEDDGSDSRYMMAVQAMLHELASQQGATRAFVEQAVARKLVIETKLDVGFNDGATVALDGLYGIDERQLLRQAGAIEDKATLVGLFAMLLSLEQVGGLVRRKNARIAAEAAWFDPGR